MRYKVVLSYDGSQFLGWQKQSDKRSVQGVLEAVLQKISKEPVQVHGSGRTDAKVHALRQACHFDSDLNMDANAWHRALNSLVPADIKILSVTHVNDEFHAQYHAQSKRYEYRLNMGSYNPFERHYTYQYNKMLNVDAIRNLLKIYVGEHDFTSFNATELSVVENQVRTVKSFEVEQDGECLLFKIHGSGFLRYMVRMLVASCVEVGSGKATIDDMITMLEARDKRAFARNIDPCGLYLYDVIYEEGWEINE